MQSDVSRTNNVLESFFRVLKHFLLRGVTSMTLLKLIEVWEVQQSRIIINLTKVGINVAKLLPNGTPITPVTQLELDGGEVQADEEEKFSSESESESDEEKPIDVAVLAIRVERMREGERRRLHNAVDVLLLEDMQGEMGEDGFTGATNSWRWKPMRRP